MIATLALSATALFPHSAEAATYSATACDPDTTDGTSAPKVTIDGSWLADGQVAPVLDNDGNVSPYITSKPPKTGNFGSKRTPLCVVGLGSDGKLTKAHWIFCLNKALDACGEYPLKQSKSDNGARVELSALDRARLGYILTELGDFSTTRSRALISEWVWCVSEGLGANDPVPHDDRFPGKTCPNWNEIDPTLILSPKLSMTADTVSVDAGEEARFTVESNLPKVRVTGTGLSSLEVCGEGGSLDGDVLSYGENSDSATLCARRDVAGTGELLVEPVGATGTTARFWNVQTTRDDCQGYLDSVPRTAALEARAGTEWLAVPVAAPASAKPAPKPVVKPVVARTPVEAAPLPVTGAPIPVEILFGLSLLGIALGVAALVFAPARARRHA